VKVVADAGPLMALAKVDALAVLFRLYPKVLTPPAVYEETVVAAYRTRCCLKLVAKLDNRIIVP
jgi:predicted nucleic acid-binding protein